jgi:Calcineurin-like phosphoesterase
MFNMLFSFIPQMTSIRSRCAIPAFLLRTCSLVFAIICGVTPVHADQSQSFVWIADTQGSSPSKQVNTSVLTPIVDTILAMSTAPKVVIFGGDATSTGGTANLTYFKSLFTDRLDAAGIPSAYAIGNHEPFAPPTFIQPLAGQQQFQALFNSNWIQNGPAGFNNLAFSFHLGNSLFIVADSFYATTNASKPPFGINTAQQDWMKGLLQNNTADHSFVFTHVPAYSPSLPSPNLNMTDAWTVITTSGNATNTNASILFSGHDHLYYRTLQNVTYQVLSGSAGAPLGCENTSVSCGPVYPGDVYALQYNYTVVTIDGRYVNVNVFDPANHTLDAFRFFDNSGENNATITNTTAIAPDPQER